MITDQNSRYTNAVGKRNIASRVDDIKNPLAMGGRARSVSESQAGIFKGRTSSVSAGKMNGFSAAEEAIRPRGPRSMGSAAGFRGEKVAHLEMNGGGYMGSTKRGYGKSRLNSVGGAVFDSKTVKQSFLNKVSGRFAQTSKMRMNTIKSLSRLA